MSKTLSTWGGRSRFKYEGSVVDGTLIHYGKAWSVRVSAEQYRALLNRFKGMEADMGTSRDTAPAGSVGTWLQENVTKTAIASYVGPILVEEGYAERIPKQSSKIRFR